MKRICLLMMLLVMLLTGCADSEPSTVATVSPGSGISATDHIPANGNSYIRTET